MSVGPSGPKRRGRWFVRFQGDEIKRQETAPMSLERAEATALDMAAYFEREGCAVSLSLPLPCERLR